MQYFTMRKDIVSRWDRPRLFIISADTQFLVHVFICLEEMVNTMNFTIFHYISLYLALLYISYLAAVKRDARSVIIQKNWRAAFLLLRWNAL